MSKLIEDNSTTVKNGQSNPLYVTDNTNLHDTFGRLVVGEPFSVLDINFIADSNTTQTHQKSTGTATINRVQTHMIMTGLDPADTAMIRSRGRAIYEPGRSHLVFLTGILNNGGANSAESIARIGYFDAEDGIFFEYTNNDINIVIRSSSSGSMQETRIARANWSENPLFNIDASKTQIFSILFSWLGVGLVVCSVVINGKTMPLHKFKHANIETLPYMTTGSLYPCYSLTGIGSVLANCSSVQSIGGFHPFMRVFSADNHFTPKAIINNVFTPTLAIRIKAGAKINVKILSITVHTLTPNTIAHTELLIGRDGALTLTDPVWVSMGPESNVEYDISATAFAHSSNQVLISSYIGRETSGVNISAENYSNTYLTMNIDGVSDIALLTVGSLSGNETVVTNIQFGELA